MMGYLFVEDGDAYKISPDGWKRISELRKERVASNQGFIAMAFRDETKSISIAFQKALVECGYTAKRIDEKEHNNQIVPEIFFEIRRSKFVVVDVTIPNNGAYYEAGYAEALGKQVIVCRRKNEFSSGISPHFDIAQKSMIIWENEDELEAKLKKRIEATVGVNTL